MTPEEEKRLRFTGKVRTSAELANLLHGMTFAQAEFYIEGKLEGIREFVTAYGSNEQAYALLQRAADNTNAHLAVPAPTTTEPST